MNIAEILNWAQFVGLIAAAAGLYYTGLHRMKTDESWRKTVDSRLNDMARKDVIAESLDSIKYRLGSIEDQIREFREAFQNDRRSAQL